MESVAQQFTEFSATKLEESLANVRRCTALLDDAGVWWRPNEVSNSIGNLVLHLAGNVRQWVVAGLGGEPFDRDRPAEFAARETRPASEALDELTAVMTRAAAVIRGLEDAALVAEYEVQGYRVTGTAVVAHVVEHFSFHTGQIVSTAKLILNRDLSLYDAQGRRIDGERDGVP